MKYQRDYITNVVREVRRPFHWFDAVMYVLFLAAITFGGYCFWVYFMQ
jgi:hypothetical protein